MHGWEIPHGSVEQVSEGTALTLCTLWEQRNLYFVFKCRQLLAEQKGMCCQPPHPGCKLPCPVPHTKNPPHCPRWFLSLPQVFLPPLLVHSLCLSADSAKCLPVQCFWWCRWCFLGQGTNNSNSCKALLNKIRRQWYRNSIYFWGSLLENTSYRKLPGSLGHIRLCCPSSLPSASICCPSLCWGSTACAQQGTGGLWRTIYGLTPSFTCCQAFEESQ